MEVPDNRLCVLCCFSHSSKDKQDTVNNCLSDDSNLKAFLNYIDQLDNNYNDSSEKLGVFDKTRLLKLIGDCGDKVTLCGQCSKLISKAVEVRREVGVVEEKVIRMQRELLEELRKLKELITNFYGRMRAIEATVMGSDLECLESLMEGIMERSLRRRRDGDFVLFREKISQVVEDLGAYRHDLEERHGLEELDEPYSSPAGLEATTEEDVPDFKMDVAVTTTDFRSVDDLDNLSTVAVVNGKGIGNCRKDSDKKFPAQLRKSDSGEVGSAIREGRNRSGRSKAANVKSYLVQGSEEDDSSDENLSDISSDYEPNLQSGSPVKSSLPVASLVVSKKKRRVVIESSSSEEIEEEEPRSGSSDNEESDFEPPSSPPPNHHRSRDQPSKESKPPATLNIPTVKFFGMSKLKKAVINSIIQRKKLQFRTAPTRLPPSQILSTFPSVFEFHLTMTPPTSYL